MSGAAGPGPGRSPLPCAPRPAAALQLGGGAEPARPGVAVIDLRFPRGAAADVSGAGGPGAGGGMPGAATVPVRRGDAEGGAGAGDDAGAVPVSGGAGAGVLPGAAPVPVLGGMLGRSRCGGWGGRCRYWGGAGDAGTGTSMGGDAGAGTGMGGRGRDADAGAGTWGACRY